MIVENDPSARMQLRSRGQLVAPASCCVCGNATCDEGYLDLGAFVDFHGTLYLCMNCITQGAEVCGMFTPQEVAHFQRQIEGLIKKNETLTKELANVTEHRDALDNALRHAYSSSSGDVVSVPVSETSEGPSVRESEPKEPTPEFNPKPTGGTKLRDVAFDG